MPILFEDTLTASEVGSGRIEGELDNIVIQLNVFVEKRIGAGRRLVITTQHMVKTVARECHIVLERSGQVQLPEGSNVVNNCLIHSPGNRIDIGINLQEERKPAWQLISRWQN